MASRKQSLLADQGPPSRTSPDGVSGTAELVPQADELSPEFFDLIHDWDPDAANDNYYVTSSDFIELHSQLRKFLIRRMIWWATSVCLGMSILFYIYH